MHQLLFLCGIIISSTYIHTMQKTGSIWGILQSNIQESQQVVQIHYAYEHGQNINKINVMSNAYENQEITPVWYAVAYNKLEVLKALLKCGADMYTTSIIFKNYDGCCEIVEESPIQKALKTDNIYAVKILLRYGYDRTKLSQQEKDIIKSMFKYQAKTRCTRNISMLPIIHEESELEDA